jgi:hypothetical protein
MDIEHELKTNSEARSRDRMDDRNLRQEPKTISETASEADFEGALMKESEMKSLAGITGRDMVFGDE